MLEFLTYEIRKRIECLFCFLSVPYVIATPTDFSSPNLLLLCASHGVACTQNLFNQCTSFGGQGGRGVWRRNGLEQELHGLG